MDLFVGLAVAKDRVDLHVRPGGRPSRSRTTSRGWSTACGPSRPPLIALEATGVDEATVAATLASAGWPVAVVNPRQTRDFARATGLLAKTDTLDARVIAHFAEAIRPARAPAARRPTAASRRAGGPAPPVG
jgi:transposase